MHLPLLCFGAFMLYPNYHIESRTRKMHLLTSAVTKKNNLKKRSIYMRLINNQSIHNNVYHHTRYVCFETLRLYVMVES